MNLIFQLHGNGTQLYKTDASQLSNLLVRNLGTVISKFITMMGNFTIMVLANLVLVVDNLDVVLA
jgi:hypothetical protein